jgi:sulfoxide reductase catalytic subunit YedY
MLIKKPEMFQSSMITDRNTYLNRRTLMQFGALAATSAATGYLYRKLLAPAPQVLRPQPKGAAARPVATISSNLPGEPLTPYEDITNYNNFYEFSTDKRAVAERAKNFVTDAWTVSVEGLVNKPRTYDLNDLIGLGQPEDRIYRLRCVEGWSMIVPWQGFSLAKLLKEVEPTAAAQFVYFETLLDAKRMPNQRSGVLDWPYVEGLRLDEALHPLTILATGLYGDPLPPQDGAPIRLVVPWKYGFKSIKSITKIRLVAQQPETTWGLAAPSEYGFYSNVNPRVPHPRWSQAQERRIGEFGLRDTLMFNGYADDVAHLYANMDLKKYF